MCCFSGRVTLVSGTSIFARRADDRTQCLAYAMNIAADADLAMVLPLPTDPAAGEGAVSFVDLSGEPYLFTALDALFPASLGLESAALSRAAPQAKTLAVHAVGAFEASFVPTPEDFERLDARFRLAPDVVAALCARERFGFAVFQLRGLGGEAPTPAPSRRKPWWKRIFSGDDAPPAPRAPNRHFHPMGITFRSRTPEALFFPTVHVHDGSLPARAHFDHTLYAQGAADADWEESDAVPHPNTVERAKGILAGGERVKRLTIEGERPNRDVVVPA